jgi:hypothetical protein
MMNLSQLKNPTMGEWGNFLLAVVLWLQFALPVPCELSYPWNVLVKFLAILSPFFWYKSLNISHKKECERETARASSSWRINRLAASRLIYLIVGVLTWGAFVFGIPPDKFYDTVTLDIAGFLAPFVLLAGLMIQPDLSSPYPPLKSAYGLARQPLFLKTAIKRFWILRLFSTVLWVYFVYSLAYSLLVWRFVGFIALNALLLALPWALSVDTKRDIAARSS